jgi:hypothetical protein
MARMERPSAWGDTRGKWWVRGKVGIVMIAMESRNRPKRLTLRVSNHRSSHQCLNKCQGSRVSFLKRLGNSELPEPIDLDW